MGKCQCCNNKGIFLKLKMGLCEDCYSELIDLENTYEKILSDLNSSNVNYNSLISSTNSLIIKLRKFDKVSNSIKVDDCLRLIDNINALYTNTKEETTEVKKLSFPENKTPIIENADNQQKEITSISSKASSLNGLFNLDENPLKNETIELIVPPNVTKASILQVPFSNNLDNNKELLKNINIATNSINEISAPPNVRKKYQLDFTEEKDSLNKIIKNNFTSEISDILRTLTSMPLSTNDLAYYTFILKNYYEKFLQELNEDIVDNINIPQLIDNNLSNLSNLINCPKADVFDLFNYVAFSIQTTGIRTEINSILEISALKVSFGEVQDKFYTLVNPIKSISLSCSNKTGIKNEDVENSPTISTAINEFYKFCGNNKLICHNAGFNGGFINYYYNKYYNKEFSNNIECTMKLYRTRYKSYHGDAPQKFDLNTCCNDLLSEEEISEINSIKSFGSAAALGTYKIYEILKYKYR